MTLDQLQSIRHWHLCHRAQNPVEYHIWDMVLTFWVIGWVGWFPTYLLDLWWGAPLCGLGVLLPGLYVSWRAAAHRKHRVRCDWLYASRK